MAPRDPGRYLAERYSRDAEGYRRHWAPVLLTRSRLLLDPLSLHGAERVLDLGAGVGALLPEIRRRVPAGMAVGVDRSEGMIRLAPGEFPRAVMDAADLGFRDESFDAVVMAFVLFHLPDPSAGLAEVHRVLRPGGIGAVATWGGDPHDFPANRLWYAELDRAGAVTEDPWPSRHDLMDTPEKVTGLLQAAGLQEVETRTEPLEDRIDLEEFLVRRTSLGFSRCRLASLGQDARAACLARARRRLERLGSEDFVSREVAILAWGRKGPPSSSWTSDV